MPDLPIPPSSPRPNTAAGKQTPVEQGLNIPGGWKPTPAEPIPVVRCTTIKKDGTRCARWSIRGATVCLRHGGSLPNVQKAAQDRQMVAKLRLIDDTSDAMAVLEDLLKPGVLDNVRLAAAKEILDRAGVKSSTDININVEHKVNPIDAINEKLATIAGRKQETPADSSFTNAADLDIIDTELVDQGENPVTDNTDTGLTNE